MSTILPWVAAFLFGAVAFAVGKRLQSIEREKRLQRKQSSRPLGPMFGLSNLNMRDTPSLFNQIASYQGKKKEKQEESIYDN
jgi:hypothetical protein